VSFFESTQFGLLAEGLFDLLGPALIFGIYIIGALAKNWVKRDKGGSQDENQSELKKAVRKRYEQIRQRQVGEETPQLKRTPKAIPVARTIRQEENRPRQAMQTQKSVVGYGRPKPPQTIQQAIAPEPVHLQKKKAAQKQIPKKVDQAPKCRHAGSLLENMMSRPENLRSAIILKEILDKPLALRSF
jgi:hypothetical protein